MGQQHCPHRTPLPDQGMAPPEPAILKERGQRPILRQAAEGTSRWRHSRAQRVEFAFLLPDDPGGRIALGQPVVEEQSGCLLCKGLRLRPEGGKTPLVAGRGGAIGNGLEGEQASGGAL